MGRPEFYRVSAAAASAAAAAAAAQLNTTESGAASVLTVRKVPVHKVGSYATFAC